MLKYPYTTKPEDVIVLLQKLPSVEVPKKKIEVGYFRSIGFSQVSSGHLFDILKKLDFVNTEDEPSATWLEYVADEQRGLILASSLKKAYSELFNLVFCPYLEDDATMIEFFQKEEPKTTRKNMALLIETFRNLSQLADFQDLMCVDEPAGQTPPEKEQTVADVKVNPNLQLNIEIHIDPATSDEKIETIFKNMQKYLLGKANPG